MATTTVERARYTHVAILLHWAIAALIIFNIATGLLFDDMSEGVEHALVPIHISSGITILALTVIRILWRLTHRPPPMLPMPAWQKLLAGTVYLLFYVGMLAAPLSGWAMTSSHAVKPGAAPYITMIWGVVPLPRLTPVTRIADQPDGAAKLHEVHEQIEQVHGTLGWILLGLLVLHVGGAMKHQVVDRRRELGRMGIGPAELERA